MIECHTNTTSGKDEEAQSERVGENSCLRCRRQEERGKRQEAGSKLIK